MNAPAPNAPISNNLIWAILATLFCCLPLGIVSIVNAAKVDGLVAAGDYAGARTAADNAKKWAIYAAITWVVLIILYFILVMFGAMSGVMTGM